MLAVQTPNLGSLLRLIQVVLFDIHVYCDSVDQVRKHLQEFFDKSQMLLSSDPQYIVELCLLCVQCLEVSFLCLQQFLKSSHFFLQCHKTIVKQSFHNLLSKEVGYCNVALFNCCIVGPLPHTMHAMGG